MNLTTLRTKEELKKFFTKTSDEQFKNDLPLLSMQDISNGFALMQGSGFKEIEGKREELLAYLIHSNQLGRFGKSLNVPALIELLDFLARRAYL